MPFRLQTFCITVFIRINALGAYLLFGLLGWRLFEAGAYFNKLTENVWLKIAKYLQFFRGWGWGSIIRGWALINYFGHHVGRLFVVDSRYNC